MLVMIGAASTDPRRSPAVPETVSRGPSRRAGCEAVVELGDSDLADACGEVRARLPQLLARSPSTLVVDLSEVTRLSSAVVATLLWISRECRARSVVVVLRRPSRASVETLRRAGLQSTLPLEQPGSPDRRRHVMASALRRAVT